MSPFAVPAQISPSALDRISTAIYAGAILTSISIWFLAIRAPLWLDETVSFTQINGGFSQIIARQGWPTFPIYSYILWLDTKLLGTSELALRVPSVLAMLASSYLVYLIARELFDRDVSTIATVIFCLHPIVVFAAIDVRPYAFGALATTAATYCLVRLRHQGSLWFFALFGGLAALIVHFQIMFAVILPALALGFFAVTRGDSKVRWRQFAVSLATFTVVFLPTIPGFLFMLRTSAIHVFEQAPSFLELLWTLAPGKISFILLGAAFVAAAIRRIDLRPELIGWRLPLCALLGILPVLILYGVSVGTSAHIFTARYRLVAVPGIALCWAIILSLFNSRFVRLLFCVALVAITAYQDFRSPLYYQHGYTWKYALEFAQQNAFPDNATVLICSDFPESDHLPMPTGTAVSDNLLFGPLSYYKLSIPIIALPRSLNEQAIQIGSSFVQQQQPHPRRFLALAYLPSYETLKWLTSISSETYQVRVLGKFDEIVVLEFKPPS